MGRDTLFFWIF